MNYSGWGNYPRIEARPCRFDSHISLQSAIKNHDEVIARGNGRSYGDSALGENLILTRPYNYFLGFDDQNGILHCQAGVLLSEILESFIHRGWFLSVTPGTKLITVGGAIASDVHGKNHHNTGSFCQTIVEFSIMTGDGKILTCSPIKNEELFRASCGGMGLTGVIIDAKIKLQRISSSLIDQTTIKTKNLKETFEAFEQYKDSTYSVSWIDCMAKGIDVGKGLLMVGEHSQEGHLHYINKQKMTLPFDFPSFSLSSFSVKAFNSVYYGKVRKTVSEQKVSLDSFFYPLDAIDCWNRIYGKKGFLQYQFVLPLDQSYLGMEKILSKIADSGKGSFLAVLKLFGKGNDNWLSFPMEGYTLALDFKVEPGVFDLFDELDKIVIDHGGRFYLAKDARITKDKFESGYRGVKKFRELREAHEMNKKFNSLQSKRIGI